MSSIGFQAHVDRAKVARAKRWNAIILAVSLVFAAGLVPGAVVMFVEGSWPVGILAGLGALAAVLSVVLGVKRATVQRLLAAGGDLALTVDDAGVRPAGAPLIPWSEIVFVGVLDDRARSAALRGPTFAGMVASATLKAGSGTLLCELGVRDGVALKNAFGGAPGAERVTLWDPFDGVRRGLIPLVLDAVLDDGVAQQAAQVLIDAAWRRGIATARFTGVMDYLNWKNPMLDLKWPTPAK